MTRTRQRRWGAAAFFAIGYVSLFGADLAAWLRFGLGSEMYSYTLLVPVVVLYLLRALRPATRMPTAPGHVLPLLCLAVGMLVLALAGFRGDTAAEPDRARLAMGVTCLLAGAGAWLGWDGFRARLFPFSFLYVMIPLPGTWEAALSAFLQHASGLTAYGFLYVSGIPVVREGPYLTLPGLELEVAEECSGIRSTVVLLVTSILGARLLLTRGWSRVALVAVVIPLGIARNAFRILVISALTLYVDPGVIHGPLHRQGGPIFFALSLVVLLVFLLLLRRWERRLCQGGG